MQIILDVLAAAKGDKRSMSQIWDLLWSYDQYTAEHEGQDSCLYILNDSIDQTRLNASQLPECLFVEEGHSEYKSNSHHDVYQVWFFRIRILTCIKKPVRQLISSQSEITLKRLYLTGQSASTKQAYLEN